MENKLLHTVAHVDKQVSEGVIEAVVGSTSVLDRQGEIVEQSGWELKNFQKNPVILWGHNVEQTRPPIGKAEKVWVDGDGKRSKLMFKVKFDLLDTFAAEIYRKVKEGFINTVSVGFMPLERVDNKYLKNELLELSFVPVPANPEAVVVMREMGIEPVEEKDLYKTEEETKVLKFIDMGIAPESETWDLQGELAKSQPEEIVELGIWSEPNKDLDKLVHHRHSDKKVVFRGLTSAMATLLGANGGVELTDQERKEVYDHLVEHYKQFGKEAPEYSKVENQIFKGVENEIHSIVLDREDKHQVRLIKKLLSELNKPKEVKNTTKQTEVVQALRVIESALTKITFRREVK